MLKSANKATKKSHTRVEAMWTDVQEKQSAVEYAGKSLDASSKVGQQWLAKQSSA